MQSTDVEDDGEELRCITIDDAIESAGTDIVYAFHTSFCVDKEAVNTSFYCFFKLSTVLLNIESGVDEVKLLTSLIFSRRSGSITSCMEK